MVHVTACAGPRSRFGLNELLGCNLSDVANTGEQPSLSVAEISLLRKDRYEWSVATMSRRYQTLGSDQMRAGRRSRAAELVDVRTYFRRGRERPALIELLLQPNA